MKLVIKHYLASLKERDELDAILPDLLSQMGLNVFSRPGRGTRQFGVDVAAVGRIDGGPESVYLFSVKARDLTRQEWGGGSAQSLRPSLDEIKDAYIPNHLPTKHRDKPIVVCLCFGGDIREDVRQQVTGYIRGNTVSGLTYEEWNGDILADLISRYLLSPELLPDDARPLLRKSLALLDEPEASFGHFQGLTKLIASASLHDDQCRIRGIRQLCICLWILYGWAQSVGNLESAYLSSELTLLFGWELAKGYWEGKTKAAKSIQATFGSILNLYLRVSNGFIAEKIIPGVAVRHGLSSAIRSSSQWDVNLKLFDILGRLAIAGLWSHHQRSITEDRTVKNQCEQGIRVLTWAVKSMISNNPTLFTPFLDEQAIDISLAALFLALDAGNNKDMMGWLATILEMSVFSFMTQATYPCNIKSYSDLLEHPKRSDEYRKEVTSGSILYPTIALWSGLLDDQALYKEVQDAKVEHFGHSNFQFWYPDESTESNLYTNSERHGATLSNLSVDRPVDGFLNCLWTECDRCYHFSKLSAIHYGIWPLVLVACRHYRLPMPIHFTLRWRNASPENTADVDQPRDML